MKRIAIFCGSSSGFHEIYGKEAYNLGQHLAQNNYQIVYGGANVGLMGILADAALNEQGKVIGVIPDFLRNKEIAHPGITELIIVEDMQERKLKINELCDGVMALPGGFGTIDELFEMLTWGQLGLHKKPIGLLNIAGYFDPLIEFINRAETEGFLKKENADMLLSDSSIEGLLVKMHNYAPPNVGKWISDNVDR